MPAEVTPDTLGDWNWVIERLATLDPLVPPDTSSTYQSMSYGFLVGEVVRRTDPKGRSFADFVQDEICAPLGIGGIFFGLPDAGSSRAATLYAGDFAEPGGEVAPLRSLTVPRSVRLSPEIFNLPAMRAAACPATNGFANARSVARLFAMLANGGELDGVRLLSTWRVRSFTAHRPDPYGVDLGVGRPLWVGIGGFWLGGPHPPAAPVIGTSPTILAHPGAGGSYGWADPDLKLAAAICHNKMTVTDNPPTPVDRHPFIPLGDALRRLASSLLKQNGGA
jgi:CubicO group peptidase (beta-lactamase class C family)